LVTGLPILDLGNSMIRLVRSPWVNEPLFAASVPMTKEADTSVLPAHFENSGDKSGTR